MHFGRAQPRLHRGRSGALLQFHALRGDFRVAPSRKSFAVIKILPLLHLGHAILSA